MVLHALRRLPRDPRNLGAVIFLGTPILNFTEGWNTEILTRWTPMAVYLLALAVAFLFHPTGAWWWVKLAYTISVGLVTFVEAGRLFIKNPTEPHKRTSLYGSGRPYAYAFACDEAVGGLIRTDSTMRQPRKLFEQFMARAAPGTHAVAPSRPYSQYTFTNTWPVLTLRGLPNLIRQRNALSLLFLPVRLWLICVCALAVIPECLILAAHVLPRAVSTLRSRVSRWFLEVPGALIAGRVMRSAAVGADKSKFLGISRLPPEVQQLESISPELEERMNDITKELTASIGSALHSGLGIATIDDLKASVLAHFSDPRLAHSQYSREQEIIEKVASRVASARRGGSQANIAVGDSKPTAQ